MNPGENFETYILVPLVLLVDLVKIYTGHGYSNSGKFFGRPFMIHLFDIHFNLEIDT